MSIKKLFDSTSKSRNYLSDTNSKDAFKRVESGKNVESLSTRQNEFVPQVDYSRPENFARYGSAYLYYKGAIEHIYNYYPYDGSDFEINEFYNGLLGVEKFIFDKTYPRTNGLARFSANGWGAAVGLYQDGGYGTPANLEYIDFKGGPHTSSYSNLSDAFPSNLDSKRDASNIYDTDVYTTEGLPTDYGLGTRESNLKSNFDNGVTVEFWLKKDGFNTSLTAKEVVFDMWNNVTSSDAAYARMRIELTGASTGSPFLITAKSSSSGLYQQSIGEGLTVSSLSTFGHYAFTFYNSGSHLKTELYVNGILNDTNVQLGRLNELNSKDMVGRLGALLTSSVGPSSDFQFASGSAGDGKLSGSLDEFRFWKARRTAEDIGLNWRTQVRGGTNTDVNNTTLGVYYKFNEGITGYDSVDSSVLDYSGRISNGRWTGYDAFSRLTSSALVEAGVRTSEYLDPIIYESHPDVDSLKTSLLTRGTNHDLNNNSAFVSTLPSWIVQRQDSKETDLRLVSHIVGSYLDKLYLQIQSVPRLKTQTYTSASVKAIPFAQHMPQSLGLFTPDLFIESTVLEKFKNRTETTFMESDLNETKNLIYLNLYNSLTGLYKAKGTEKAVRNALRCFNLDDRVIKLKAYSDKNVFTLKNNLRQTMVPNTAVNFNNKSNLGAVVYQAADSTNADSVSFISGTSLTDKEALYGFTLETNITFPRFNPNYGDINRNFTDVSLFGLNLANATTPNDTTWESPDPVNFQVFAVRPKENSKSAFFKLSSSVTPSPFPLLTSSLFFDVYDDSQWSFSVRLRPSIYPFREVVSGSDTYDYNLEFRGINAIGDTIQNSFALSASIGKVVGREFLNNHKRVYAGARRTNVTGAVQQQTDVLFNNVKYWTKYIEKSDINQHLFDINNAGTSGSYEHISPLDPNLDQTDVKNANSLALHWTYDNITGSNSDGNFFYVTDISSGSAELRENYGWVGAIAGSHHTGYGFGFLTSSTDVVKKQMTSMLKFTDPESPISSEMIQTFDRTEKFFFEREVKPDFFFNIEKSMYEAISEEMLTFFAGVVDFNNVIGEPVHRYRMRYKPLEKLREIFFRRSGLNSTSNVEKFINYYKWLDDAIAIVIDQLLPAGAALKPDTYNIIESHVLERNKYQSQFPILEEVESTEGAAMGINELAYNWKFGHAPLSDSQSDNTLWWEERAIRTDTSVSSGDVIVDNQRENIRQIAAKNNDQETPILYDVSRNGYSGSVDILRRRSLPYRLVAEKTQVIKGGVNFEESKDINLTYNAVRPAGPINSGDGIFVPENVLLSFTTDLADIAPITNDVLKPNVKTKRYFKTLFGRNYEDGLGYYNMKSSRLFPFNVFSSSVISGYNAAVIDGTSASLEITNLHNDVYGPDMEKPMQGPFTEYAVGGHQSRHIAINRGTDGLTTRPEAWKVVLGFSNSAGTDGAIGLVGPDYPTDDINYAGYSTEYPVKTSQKAVYYRDFTAKRPVNIKNILMRTGSTILGNYEHNYQVVHSVGGFSNPRAFVDNQPILPTEIIQNKSSSQARSILDVRRTDDGHFQFIPDYDVSYLHSNANNKSIIRSRFSAPGGVEVLGQGYGDIRSNDYSVYNALTYRNLSVRRPYQFMSSSSESDGVGTTGIRVSDLNGNDFGLIRNLADHSGLYGRDKNVTDPGNLTEQDASFHKVNRNALRRIFQNSDGTFTTSSTFDNFFVQHQIPRSDRQYSWYTGSLAQEALEDFLRYGGFAPVVGEQAGQYAIGTGTSRTYVPYFNFVTSSDAKAGDIFQPSNALNIYIVDPIDALSDNNLGLSLATSNLSYYNNELLGALTGSLNQNSDYFNLLMTKRKNTFGYRGVPFTGPARPAILRKQVSENKLSYTNSPTTRQSFTPISVKTRTIQTSISSSVGDVSLAMPYEQNKKYFNNSELNNNFAPYGQKDYDTVFDQINTMTRSDPSNFRFNWIIYSDDLFPSDVNEFSSGSATRIGYDNLYWRATDVERFELHRDSIFFNSFGQRVSQSSWPLDAPNGFLTRGASDIPIITSGITTALAFSNSAGELQNEYEHVHLASAVINQSFQNRNIKIGGLYARKSLLTNPFSVVSPSGMVIPETGSGFSMTPNTLDYTASFSDTDMIEPYGGMAVWEASTQAGVVESLSNASTFVPSPSEPWYSSIEDFNSDLKLISRGYSVIPEFRISEHINDYLKFGISSDKKFNTFEIVGTGKDSSNDNFYVDYSNSDFLEEFANIKQQTGMTPDEIVLVCSASIKFNPYKGFYPAQRTIDLVEQFRLSYADALQSESDGISAPGTAGATRPLAQAIFAPGILFNTIKSGLAVDYPIVLDGGKINKRYFGSDESSDPGVAWMVTTESGSYTGEEYWDKRVPFEAIIDPSEYLSSLEFFDMEAHPSASTNTTASFIQANTDDVYKRMSSNFFGAVPNFFLDNSKYTSLESEYISNDLRFDSGSVYGARIKVYRSLSGSKSYLQESGSSGNNTGFSANGAKFLDTSVTPPEFKSGTSYQLPQDPRRMRKEELQESFTIYSRPGAFGPEIAGRPTGSNAVSASVFATNPIGSVNGENPAFTPPYYNGESWLDLVFRPQANTSYDLKRILSEVRTVSWRFDPGPSASAAPNGSSTGYVDTQFIPSYGSNISVVPELIYDGKNINKNVMQLTNSFNCFGVVEQFETTTDNFDNPYAVSNNTIGAKWVIQPKFETPHLNFNNKGVNPITNADGNLSLPQYSSGSVPRGIWHQFGAIEPDPKKGVFFEISEIPSNWLKYHYDVRNNNTVYNDSNFLKNGNIMHKEMKNLTEIIPFREENKLKKMGELANSRSLFEAIVVVPYQHNVSSTVDRNQSYEKKEFFNIDREKVDSCLKSAVGSQEGDSLDSAGISIRNLVNTMQKYVLPPQFDFLNNTDIDPMAMYFFEFEYKLDRDDLNYIWQNLAPRNYRKITQESVSVAHKLGENELMTSEDITDPNTRFMVFKVKYRGMDDYFDTTTSTVGSTNGDQDNEEGYKLSFNWPYDYVSFVELAKISAKSKFVDSGQTKSTSTANGGTQPTETTTGTPVGETITSTGEY